MMFWIIVTAVAVFFSLCGVFLLAAVPSSGRASNGDVLFVVALCFGVVFAAGLMLKGILSLFGV